jgi:hypothetical protein
VGWASILKDVVLSILYRFRLKGPRTETIRYTYSKAAPCSQPKGKDFGGEGCVKVSGADAPVATVLDGCWVAGAVAAIFVRRTLLMLVVVVRSRSALTAGKNITKRLEWALVQGGRRHTNWKWIQGLALFADTAVASWTLGFLIIVKVAWRSNVLTSLARRKYGRASAAIETCAGYVLGGFRSGIKMN